MPGYRSGRYPDVSLASARSIVHDTGTAVAEGGPRSWRNGAQGKLPASQPHPFPLRGGLFPLDRDAPPHLEDAKHADQWRSTLATYANPLIGSKPVDKIDSGDVLDVLTSSGPSSLRPPAGSANAWRRSSTGPSHTAGGRTTPPAGPFSRCSPAAQGEKAPLGPALRGSPGGPEAGTGVDRRSSDEALIRVPGSDRRPVRRGAAGRLFEVDWESRTWTVPASRMKARREHRVPFAGPAMEVCQKRGTLTGTTAG